MCAEYTRARRATAATGAPRRSSLVAARSRVEPRLLPCAPHVDAPLPLSLLRRRAGRHVLALARLLRQRRRVERAASTLGRMPAAEPRRRPAQCGELEVPEDRAKPDGRKIRIFAAVLPANTLSPKADPLSILAGGPGQAASTLAPFAARLNEVRRTRDVVLIDQRGTGRSSPLAVRGVQAARRRGVRDRSAAARQRLCGGAARTGRRRGAIHDDRVDRRPRGDARGARLRALEPVGRQLRHARRAGVPAPASGPRAHA